MENLFTDVWGRSFAQGGTVNGVDDVLARSAIGNPSNAVTETLWGLNHRSISNSIPINKDYYGLAFFTRPDIRFTTDNLLKVRKFTPMLTNRETSLPRAIRAMLDFRHDTHNEDSYNCALIDPKQAFIPLLTNQLTSMSGWPDLELPTFKSEPGVYGEEWSFADGICEMYRTWDMTATFRNIPGDPITAMFYYWLVYAQSVYEGLLTPYSDNLAENTIDYQTRIYRVVLDSSKRFVQKIACTGASFPTSVPMGMSFNFELDTPINRLDTLPIAFRCIGAEYLDDIIIHDFNLTVCNANNDMFDDQRQAAGLVKVPYEYIFLFNYLGYPRINTATFELEWWVYNDKFLELTGGSSNADAEIDFNMADVDKGGLAAYTGTDPTLAQLAQNTNPNR